MIKIYIADEEDLLEKEVKQHLVQMDKIQKEHLDYIVKLNSGEHQPENKSRQKAKNKKITSQFETGQQSNFLFSNDNYVDALSSDENE